MRTAAKTGCGVIEAKLLCDIETVVIGREKGGHHPSEAVLPNGLLKGPRSFRGTG